MGIFDRVNIYRNSVFVICMGIVVACSGEKTSSSSADKTTEKTEKTSDKGGLVFQQAKDDTAKVQMQEIVSKLQLYKMKKNKYPASLEKVKRFFPNEKIPKDPWNNDYSYATTSSCGKGFELISYGSDGKKGGGDDISNCDIK